MSEFEIVGIVYVAGCWSISYVQEKRGKIDTLFDLGCVVLWPLVLIFGFLLAPSIIMDLRKERILK